MCNSLYLKISVSILLFVDLDQGHVRKKSRISWKFGEFCHFWRSKPLFHATKVKIEKTRCYNLETPCYFNKKKLTLVNVLFFLKFHIDKKNKMIKNNLFLLFRSSPPQSCLTVWRSEDPWPVVLSRICVPRERSSASSSTLPRWCTPAPLPSKNKFWLSFVKFWNKIFFKFLRYFGDF